MSKPSGSCPIISFAIPADDVERARQFYAAVFGWTFDEADDAHWETDGCGGLRGAIHPRHHPKQTTVQYVAVPELAECVASVEARGGKVLTPPLESTIRKGARHCICMDPEGNFFGLVEDGE